MIDVTMFIQVVDIELRFICQNTKQFYYTALCRD